MFPISNWTELDVWRYIAEEELELPSIYYAHEREVFERDGMLYAVSEWLRRPTARSRQTVRVRYRTVGDMTITGAVESDAADAEAVIAETAATRLTERGADARRRPHVGGRDGGPQARGVLLMSSLLRLATAGSVDDGKSTLIGRLLYDSKSLMADQVADAEVDLAQLDRRPARRARAGHHDRRRVPLLRHAASARSSSPTPPATSATRATWSPAPRPPTSPSCWSTPATACSSSRAATRTSPPLLGIRTWSRA